MDGGEHACQAIWRQAPAAAATLAKYYRRRLGDMFHTYPLFHGGGDASPSDFFTLAEGQTQGLWVGTKSVFCHLPVLTSLNWQKVAERGKKWKWPAGSLYMLPKASKHLHTQYVMSSGLTDCWYATKCCLSLNIISILFSPTSSPERQQPTSDRKQNNLWQKSSLKCISLFVYMSGSALNKNKTAFDD